MRILLLSDSNSTHTIRWAKSLVNHKIIVGIFTIHIPNLKLYEDTPDIQIFSSNLDRSIQFSGEAAISKLIYLKSTAKIKEIIKLFKPDIVHAHYASSYGILGAHTHFHPFILSLWGSDISSFPNRSLLHKFFLKYVLSKADLILSTSQSLRKAASKYTDKNILVTPFGIETQKFKPMKKRSMFADDNLVVGTIKSLEKNYGIDYLIKAFHKLKQEYPEIKLKLLIVGSGSEEEKLKLLVNNLGINLDTIFTGYIDHSEIPYYHNIIDIYVAVSIEESFGVAVLEASACAKPVVVSNVGGLPEVVGDNKTGFLVEKENINSLFEALKKLINNPDLRITFGINGRKKVIAEYDWDKSVSNMILIYESLNINRK